nr:extracellular solute-binding protein [Cochlodiniinecator piscidefendens]
MQHRIRAKAVSIQRHRIFSMFHLMALSVVVLFWAGLAFAQESIIRSHGISTFGDLKYPADFAHLDYVNPDAPKGGEISEWAFGGFDSMNPYSTQGRAGALASMFYETLLTTTSDTIGENYGLLAESLEYPEDRSWVIFNIRPDVEFSDGSLLTAEDVIFSYEVFAEKGLPSFRAQLERQVASVEMLGPLQVRYTFVEGVQTRDLPELVGSLPVFSKAHYIANDLDLEESMLTPMLGSAPYVIDEIDVGQTLIYARNENYWGEALPINVGRNNFDRIRIEYYADYNAAFEGFKGGSYTFRNEAASLIWATGYDFPALEEGWVVQRELPNGNIAPGQSFIYNLRRPQFQDPRVREAIGLMFNFEWSNETLFYGLYERNNSLWENTELAATGIPSEAELALLTPLADLLPEGVLTDEPVTSPVSRSRQLDRSALRRASTLLDDAGWTVGDDGMRRNAQGTVLRVEFLNDSQTFERIINPYIENLRRLGIDAVQDRVDQAQATNRERSYDFDMLTESYRMGYTPGSGLRQWFGSDTAQTSVFNKAGVADPAVDRLIEHVEAANSREELTTAVRALDRVLRALQFRTPQWYKNVYTVAYYDMFEHPEVLPPLCTGRVGFLVV